MQIEANNYPSLSLVQERWEKELRKLLQAQDTP
jgi:hypothetical protein